MLTVDELRHIATSYPDHALVLVAAYTHDGTGRVYEVETVDSNEGHLQLVITLPPGHKRRAENREPD